MARPVTTNPHNPSLCSSDERAMTHGTLPRTALSITFFFQILRTTQKPQFALLRLHQCMSRQHKQDANHPLISPISSLPYCDPKSPTSGDPLDDFSTDQT